MKEVILPSLNDIWMDNGLETLYRILKEAMNNSFSVKIEDNSLVIKIADFDKFKETVSIAVKNRIKNLIVMDEDKKLGEIKEIKKDYILIQEGTKIKGKVAFKENLYNEKTAAKEVTRIFDLIAEKGTRNCVVCGKSFSKPIKKLQQAAYPFVTKIKSLSGIRSYKDGQVFSFKEYFEEFCPSCYLRGIAEWSDDGIIYRTVSGEKATLFLPRFTTLEGLSKFKESYRPLLNKGARYRNIRVKKGSEETENTSGSFSTLLCFYEKFFFDVSGRDILGKSWAMMHVPLGSGLRNIKFHTLNLKDSILKVVEELSNEVVSVYSDVVASTFFFYDNPKGAPIDWDLTGKVRENLSEAILKDDFLTFARNLLPRKGGHIGFSKDTRKYLENLIVKWRFRTMGLNEKDLSTLKSASGTIAAASKDHLSLLYKLDKAKDKTALLDALRQISRRVVGLKPEEKEKLKKFLYPPALEEIVLLCEKNESDRKFIEDLKNILVIFSCVELSRI